MAAARHVWIQLNPQTPNGHILLADNDRLVETTPFLGWQPAAANAAGQARVSLNHFEMIKWFVPRNCIPRGGAVETAAMGISPLVARFPIAFWLRTLNELTASGLEDALESDAATTIEEFVKVFRSLTISNPVNLQFAANDFAACGENFDAPAGAAAGARGRGQGRGAVAPAAAAVPGPADIRFLNICTLLDLEEPGATCPLGPLCDLVGMLGACLTRASRADERATVRVVGGLLKSNLIAGYGEGDGLLAVSLPDYLKSLQLPPLFAAPTSSISMLRAEARDTVLYHRNDRGRRDVENSRLPLVRSRYAHPACGVRGRESLPSTPHPHRVE